MTECARAEGKYMKEGGAEGEVRDDKEQTGNNEQ
jgi:hypothetical protein